MFLTYKMFFETILSNSYSDYVCAGFLEVAYNLDERYDIKGRNRYRYTRK